MKHSDAPSVLKKYFQDVFLGFQDIEKKMIQLGLVVKK